MAGAAIWSSSLIRTAPAPNVVHRWEIPLRPLRHRRLLPTPQRQRHREHQSKFLSGEDFAHRLANVTSAKASAAGMQQELSCTCEKRGRRDKRISEGCHGAG